VTAEANSVILAVIASRGRSAANSKATAQAISNANALTPMNNPTGTPRLGR
jgi:hypothetical protein